MDSNPQFPSQASVVYRLVIFVHNVELLSNRNPKVTEETLLVYNVERGTLLSWAECFQTAGGGALLWPAPAAMCKTRLTT